MHMNVPINNCITSLQLHRINDGNSDYHENSLTQDYKEASIKSKKLDNLVCILL